MKKISVVILTLFLLGTRALADKKGVAGPGGCPDVPPLPAFYHELGVSWAYSWACCDWHTGVEYVPMVRSIHGYSADDLIRMVLRHGSGSYWLIGNEPDNGGQDDLTPSQAAEAYGEIAQNILLVDPNARLIMLGLQSGSWDGREYLRNFRAEWMERWGFGVDDVVAGWHVHAYAHPWGGQTQDEAIARVKTYVQAFRIEIDRESSGAELWVTEYGTLYGPYANTLHVMEVMTEWLEGYPGVQRYAWFYFGHPSCEWDGTALYTCASEMSSLGRLYASLAPGATPAVTLSPSTTPVPSRTPPPTCTPSATMIPTQTPTQTPTLIPTSTPVPSSTPTPTQTPALTRVPVFIEPRLDMTVSPDPVERDMQKTQVFITLVNHVRTLVIGVLLVAGLVNGIDLAVRWKKS